MQRWKQCSIIPNKCVIELTFFFSLSFLFHHLLLAAIYYLIFPPLSSTFFPSPYLDSKLLTLSQPLINSTPTLLHAWRDFSWLGITFGTHSGGQLSEAANSWEQLTEFITAWPPRLNKQFYAQFWLLNDNVSANSLKKTFWRFACFLVKS